MTSDSTCESMPSYPGLPVVQHWVRARGDKPARLADPGYEAIVGTFGGWTAALLLNAIVSEPSRTDRVVALTVNFISAGAPNSELNIRTELTGDGSSVQRCGVSNV